MSDLNVRVGFSTSDALISRIICRATRSDVSHAFLVYDSAELQQTMILEADWHEYRCVPFDTFLRRGNRIVELVRPVVPCERAIEAAADWLGSSYAYGELCGMAYVMAARALGLPARNPVHHSGALYCSEAVVRGLTACGYPQIDRLDPQAISPGGLRTYMHKAAGEWPDAPWPK